MTTSAALRCVSIGVTVVATCVAACGGHAYEAPSTTTLTAGSIPPGGESIADRIARAVCIHEVECGRVRDPGLCVDGARMQAGKELAAWTCDETSAKVSAEQCLASVRTAACSVELTPGQGKNVCPLNGGCASIEGNPAASR